jgi:SAM-dependent methyltransferase
MSQVQDDVFTGGEGDAWFRRNAAAITTIAPDNWLTTIVTGRLDPGAIRSMLDAGAANGHRLAAFRERLPNLARAAGFDISAAAIEAGRAAFPGLDLKVAPLSAIPFEEPFDLVIVSGVLCWVDRAMLARSIAELDRVVAAGGHLLIGDFRPDTPSRRRYHHRQDVELYTYKQDYAAAFEALGFYTRVHDVVIAHDAAVGAAIPPTHTIPEQDRWGYALLKKERGRYRTIA